MLHGESITVELFLALDLKLLVNVSKSLVLLLDASEFDSACLSPLQESLFRVGERDHQIVQVFLGEAVTVGGLLHTRFVCLTSAIAMQDLIVSKVAGRVEREVFVAVFVR